MIFSDFVPDITILGGGDFPSHPLPLSFLNDPSRVVCCDGAAYQYMPRFGKPWRIVGDCDSILAPRDDRQRQMLAQCQDIIRRVTEQDDNDQTKAVHYCLQHGLRRIAIVGATGGREDHTLGNVSLLLDYMEAGADIRLYTDHGVFIPCRDRIQFQVPIPEGFVAVSDADARRAKSTQVSIFNFSATGLHAQGLRYPLSDFTRWWQGTLNEAISSPVTIQGQGNFLLFVNYPL